MNPTPLLVLALALAQISGAQEQTPAAGANSGAAVLDKAAPANYILGPGDQIGLFVADLPEEFAERTFRIELGGDVNLPLAGRLHAAGLNVEELESEIRKRLVDIVKRPQVVVTIAEFASQPVSVLGAVYNPGIRQLLGQKTLFEVLSLSGGLRLDAGTSVKITRSLQHGAIPLPQATVDPTGQFSVASIAVKSIMNATGPEQNVVILPGDIVAVPKADLVYAVGSIVKPGGFPLGENETISALQVVSLAEGLQKTAAPDKARILRAVPGSASRTEIAVNMKQLLAGKGTDVPLQAQDILFIPNSGAKAASYRTLDAIITAATGLAVYGRY